MSSEKIIKAIRCLLYLLVIAVPLIYFPTGIYPFQVIKTVVLQILVEIIFALWLGLAIFYKEYRPKLTPITIALFIFMTIISLSVVFGSDWRAGLWSDESRTLGLVALWHFFALFLVLSSIYGHRKSLGLAMSQDCDNFWYKLWSLSFWTAVAVSLIGISQKFIVFPKGFNIWFHILYPGVPERIGSTFSNSTFMAGYLLFNFFIGLWLIAGLRKSLGLTKSQKLKFWFLVLGTILIFTAIFLSQTIGVILGLGAGIFILLLYFSIYGHRKSLGLAMSQKLAAGLLVLILISTGIFWFTRNNTLWQKIPGLNRIAQASFESASIRDRLITWQISLKSFREKPILGWGFENFRIAFNKNYDPKILTKTLSGSYWDKPHNVLLEYLTNTGIFGLLAYLGIFIASFYLLIKRPLINADNKLINADKNISASPFLMAMLIAYFTQNLFIFDTIGTYLMFFLVLSFINNRTSDVLNIDNNFGTSEVQKLKLLSIFVPVFLLVSLVPIYYNYQIFNASRYEYWGINYFLNRLPESSLVSFSRAIATPTPYRDDIRKNFADVIKQSHEQNIQYPNLSELQGKLAEYLKLVISRHPKDFFNYITLAEFENVFYQYNPNYLKEADELSQKALELSPERQQTYYVLAKTKLLEGDIPAAYKIFEKVVNLNPQASDPHFYFGLMAYGIGDPKKGASEIAEAERLGRVPQKIEEFIALGNFVGDYEHDYKKAIKFYNLALLGVGQNPVDKISRPNILLKLALAYYFDGDYENSRQTFLELKESVDLKQLPIYPELQPVLEELGIRN